MLKKIAVNVAKALFFFIFQNKNKARKYEDVSVLTRLYFFKCGVYMSCVACMICACDAAVNFAISLLFTSRNKQVQSV